MEVIAHRFTYLLCSLLLRFSVLAMQVSPEVPQHEAADKIPNQVHFPRNCKFQHKMICSLYLPMLHAEKSMFKESR